MSCIGSKGPSRIPIVECLLSLLCLPRNGLREVDVEACERFAEVERCVGSVEFLAELHQKVEEAFRGYRGEVALSELPLNAFKLLGEKFHATLGSHAVLFAHGFEVNLSHISELDFELLAPRDERGLGDIKFLSNRSKAHTL